LNDSNQILCIFLLLLTLSAIIAKTRAHDENKLVDFTLHRFANKLRFLDNIKRFIQTKGQSWHLRLIDLTAVQTQKTELCHYSCEHETTYMIRAYELFLCMILRSAIFVVDT